MKIRFMTRAVLNCASLAFLASLAGAQEVRPVIVNEQPVQVVISPDGTVVFPAQALPFPLEDVVMQSATIESIPPQPGLPHIPVITGRRAGKSRLVQPLPTEYASKDKNGDGQIGMYEWDRTKYAEFAKLDKNGDGFLTAQELGVKGKSVMARVRVGGGSDPAPLPNPGNLSAYNQKIGETFAFTVTGAAAGSIWGTGTYTTDSSLATAAVHAGVLKDGESGTVRVTIVESPNQFAGTAANGVTSNSWQAFPAAYTVR